MQHVIITPVKNEQEYLQRTISSIIKQTITPSEWIIIDDNSTDGSGEIIMKFQKEFSFIKYISLGASNKRKRGREIAMLFIEGYNNLSNDNWEYISKIDADMIIPEDYFEKLFSEFERDSNIGILGGTCYVESSKGQHIEKVRKDHVRGGLKTYRRGCYEEIGGIIAEDGWDGIDEINAQMLGWQTLSIQDLKVEHLRPTGNESGILRNCFISGEYSHYMGYMTSYIFARSCIRMMKKPYILGGFLMFSGYVWRILRIYPRKNDKEFIKFIRKKQLNELVKRINNKQG